MDYRSAWHREFHRLSGRSWDIVDDACGVAIVLCCVGMLVAIIWPDALPYLTEVR